MPLAVMQIGKFKGLPISAMRTAYLLWWVSQDSLRKNFPAIAGAMLSVLRHRINQGDWIEAELLRGWCDLA